MLHENKKRATEIFIEMNKTIEFEQYEISKYKRTQSSIRRQIMSEINGEEPHTIASMPKEKRNKMIIKLAGMGISKSALERATGISRGTIIRICNKK